MWRHPVDEALEDPRVQRILRIIAHEVERGGRLPGDGAYRFVLSAIGEPKVLDQITEAWRAEAWPLIYTIAHCRMIDQLKRYTWPASHRSLSAGDDALDPDDGTGDDRERPRDPYHLLEAKRLVECVRAALRCFGAQSEIRHRQAALLRRHMLDQVAQSQLSHELGCSDTAFRVRLHKARNAFKSHLTHCLHPDLMDI